RPGVVGRKLAPQTIASLSGARSLPACRSRPDGATRNGSLVTAGSGALLPRRTLAPRRLPRHECRVHVLQHDLAGDHDSGDVLPAGDVEHHRLEHLFHDRPQPASSGATQDGLLGHRFHGVLAELQLHTVDLEHPLVLLDQRVLRLGEDAHQRRSVQRGDSGQHGQATDELRDQPELQQVLGHDVLDDVLLLGLLQRCTEPDTAPAGACGDDLVQPGERARHDEQHVRGVDRDELLVRVLAASLWWHGGLRALQDLQQRLLHPLTGDVPGDRRVLALPRDLVDLVDVDDPGLGLLHVEVRGLDELEQDVLHILTDVAGLGQRCGVSDRERDVQHPRQRLRQVGLAAPGGPDQQDVRLRQLYVGVLTSGGCGSRSGLDPLVVVVDGDRQGPLRRILADDVLLEELEDLPRLGQVHQAQLVRLGELFLDDLVAQVDALVADVHARSCDELDDLLLALATEGALEQIGAFTHSRHLFSPLCRRALDNVAVWSFCAIRAGATTGIRADSPTGAPVCTVVNDTSQAGMISTRSPRFALRRSVATGVDRPQRPPPRPAWLRSPWAARPAASCDSPAPGRPTRSPWPAQPTGSCLARCPGGPAPAWWSCAGRSWSRATPASASPRWRGSRCPTPGRTHPPGTA